MSERCRREMIGLVVLVAVGCGAEEDAFELRASEIVGGTAVAADTAGYGIVINGDALGSGMFLAPGWVITAGHVLADWDDVGRWSFSSPPSTGVEFGTTFDGSQGTPFVHPNWWGGSDRHPARVGHKDPGYDVALIHFLVPFDTSNYPANKLYNQLSNDWTGARVNCFAYGAQNLNGSGGGRSAADGVVRRDGDGEYALLAHHRSVDARQLGAALHRRRRHRQRRRPAPFPRRFRGHVSHRGPFSLCHCGARPVIRPARRRDAHHVSRRPLEREVLGRPDHAQPRRDDSGRLLPASRSRSRRRRRRPRSIAATTSWRQTPGSCPT